ncbi:MULTISPECIES: UbiX family flavin prenyltransferase [unclassified Campylobacter]|uniref:UbiX family flavin prenyltransferase n=1 Tax=unclassified Campylobacter TaxID=2593542 RepID=UPI0022E9A160|nr:MULTISPECIES: UbiX family flavin prenyltransferase [unclassified Campylobacter]MDA3043544.1 UbiX family flavin prenyltransferase [Campylobacter sp. JMF_09 ED2]MDA3044091.1 UbiX family flavin prenyltransferase [Campylobacter sp. JMF_07 ED4]MDA3063441.1 UbiX family flavin prenyltransferase [Campylobacter sp. JMF_11 EL3]MDA3071066.1 UbiX family flavin prenyltransferase [Campylobacter sp. VBCF_03 NA9]MDA3074526.1 UbiX family flavin prenyltransferase [Campylobacter sp. JMF_05 ED3]
MKILVCVSGASFCEIGLNLIKFLSTTPNEIYAIISKNAKIVLKSENNINFANFISENQAVKFFDDSDIGASVASGSFGIDATIFAPCSINSLAKIHAGIADTLSTRAAAVALKERKKLILGVREMPFSPISLRSMSELANLGVIIAPPIIGGYSGAKNLEDMQNFIIGKWCDAMGVANNLFKRWQK